MISTSATAGTSQPGALFAMNIRGVGGQSLNDAWVDGPQTYLGVATHDGFGTSPACFAPILPHLSLQIALMTRGNGKEPRASTSTR